MAEFYISYEEISNLVIDFIKSTENNSILEEHVAEILAALTCDLDQYNLSVSREMIALWDNQVHNPSQLRFKDKYIPIHQIMIDFVKVAISSGLIESIIQAVAGNPTGFTFSAGASVAIALWDLFANVKTLDDWDFCVYMQAVTHFKAHKKFTFNDLKEWMPSADKPICNMHNSTWECDYLTGDDKCTIFESQKLRDAVKSLYNKGLLRPDKEKGIYVFCFER